MMGDLFDTRQIEAQPILRERIERYRRKRGFVSFADAIESLVRLGLVTEAMPDGSTLIRRGSLPEWRSPETGRDPWNRGQPALRQADSGDDGDILF